jgi:hypothetical protein
MTVLLRPFLYLWLLLVWLFANVWDLVTGGEEWRP